MDWLIASISAHQVLWSLGCYYVFAAAVGALPTPVATSSAFYQWLFTFANTLSANIARIIATKYPTSAIGQTLVGGNGK